MTNIDDLFLMKWLILCFDGPSLCHQLTKLMDDDATHSALDGHECHGRKWLVEPARRGPSRNAGGGRDHHGGGGRGHEFRGRGGRDHRGPGNRCPAGMRPTRGNYRLQVLSRLICTFFVYCGFNMFSPPDFEIFCILVLFAQCFLSVNSNGFWLSEHLCIRSLCILTPQLNS